MRREDKDLGMGSSITRRDLLQGVAMVGAGLALASQGSAQVSAPVPNGEVPSADNYPPLRNGLRGQHPGAFENAHALRDGHDFGAPESTGETYDLVVVGGGLSGLAAAYFFKKRFGADARILILDNHDDFGGHARRNEFHHDGKTLMINGGSSYMVAPSYWTQDARNLLHELGAMETDPNGRGNDAIRSRNMETATFFSREHFGQDLLVKGGTPQDGDAAFLKQTPLSPRVQEDLVRLITGAVDYMPGVPTQEKIARLRAMSYRDYLLNVAKIDPEAARLVGGIWCLGQDMGSAWFAFFRNKPGFEGLGLTRPWGSPEKEEITSDNFSMLAGNSDLARLLLRDLVPDALSAGGVPEIQMTRIDYSKMDVEASSGRYRLNSTVVRVKPVATTKARPLFEPDNSETEITYIRDNRLQTVRGKNVVLACMNNIIPYLLPELPQEQKDALFDAVRSPNLVTNVMFRNWRAFEQAGVSSFTFPKMFYARMSLSEQRYFGNYVPSESPDEPIIVSFSGGSSSGIANSRDMVEQLMGEYAPEFGTPMDDQFRMIRYALLETPFEDFERRIRQQASDALSGTDFDPARDILGITVNRWAHGFTVGRNTLFEPGAEHEPSPTLAARVPFGRITIANADAGGVSTAATAINEAFRAVRELEQQTFGFYETF
jgi:spermidine dehydrogenase